MKWSKPSSSARCNLAQLVDDFDDVLFDNSSVTCKIMVLRACALGILRSLCKIELVRFYIYL